MTMTETLQLRIVSALDDLGDLLERQVMLQELEHLRARDRTSRLPDHMGARMRQLQNELWPSDKVPAGPSADQRGEDHG